MRVVRQLNRLLSSQLTPAVKRILLVNCGVFLAIQICFAFLPARTVTSIVLTYFAENPEYSFPVFFLWQFVTYMFVHLGGLHLIFNMAILWVFAPDLEQRWGTSRFWRFYLTAGIGAGVVHACLSILVLPESRSPIVGAAAPLFAALLAYGAYYPGRRVYIWGVIPFQMKWLVPAIVALEFVVIGGRGSGVSHIPMLAGLAIGYYYLSNYHRTWNIARWRYLG